MNNQDERIAVLENEVESIEKNIDEIHTSQKEILDSYHRHEVESEHYRLLIDELIEEKKTKTAEAKSKVAARSAIVDKLIVAGVITGMGIILALAWDGLIEKIAHWG